MKSTPEPTAQTEPDDLERILNNPELSDAQIIQALIQEFYEQTYQAALERLSDPHLARQAVCLALAQVVYERRTYWGEPALADWISDRLNRILNNPKYSQETFLLETPLQAADELPLATAIEQALSGLYRQARNVSQTRIVLLSVIALTTGFLILWWAGVDQYFSMPNPFSRVHFIYPYIVQQGDSLDSIAKKAGVKASDIRSDRKGNPAQTISAGETIWLPSFKPALWQSLLPRRAAHPPSPLTLQSSPAEIKQRILDSLAYWQTLWADRVTMSYGPPGYIGLPIFVNREQLWLRQPGQGLLLVGDVNDSRITQATIFDGNRIYTTQTDPSASIMTVFINSLNVLGREYLAADVVIMPYYSPNEWEVRPIGLEAVAGRETLVVDQIDAKGLRQRRLWVDTHLGVILADRLYAQSFSGSDLQPVLQDQVVRTIQFGVTVPDGMLDPNQRHTVFVKNAKGDPLDTPFLARPAALQFAIDPVSVPLGYTSPPADFKVNQSRLSLRLKKLPGDDPFDTENQANSAPDQTRKIDVFGDDYYLGTLSLPGAGRTYLNFCRRSPDGATVLFDELSNGYHVYWFRMANPQEVFPLPDALDSPDQYAFSPSSRQLAYYRCDPSLTWCSINLLDFETGKNSHFIETPGRDVDWLGYSPDDGSLAVISYPRYGYYASSSASLNIYDLNNAKITYSGVYDLDTGVGAADAPTKVWGNAFQPLGTWPAGCDLP